MQNIILPLIIFATLFTTLNAKEPTLKKEQITQIANIILKSKNYKKIHASYDSKSVTYDKNTGIWSVRVTDSAMPLFPGSPIKFFDIRDSDRKYRIGSIGGNGFSPASSKNFHMSPLLRKKITRIE